MPSHGLLLPHKINSHSRSTAETLNVSNCNLHNKHPFLQDCLALPPPKFPASPTSSLRIRAPLSQICPLNRATYIAPFQSLFAFSPRSHVPLELGLLRCIDHVACCSLRLTYHDVSIGRSLITHLTSILRTEHREREVYLPRPS